MSASVGATLGNMSMTAETRLLEAGAEPRAELRLHPVAGQSEQVDMVMNMQMSMTMMGQIQQVQLPPVVMAMRVNVTQVFEDGSFAAETRLQSVRIEDDGQAAPDLVASLRQSMSGMEGMNIWAHMSTRGQALESRASVPDDPSLSASVNSFQQNVAQAQVLLPEEPVGVGAKWSTTSKVNSNGVLMDATTTYTLRERQGDSIGLDVAIDMAVDTSQPMTPVPGVSFTFKEFSGRGAGNVSWDLGHLMNRSTLGETMHLVLEGSQGSQTMTMGMDMGVKLEVKDPQ